MARKTFRKIITTDDVLSQVLLENKDLATRFLKHSSGTLSPKTVNVYGSNLDIFFAWNVLENGNKPFVKIKKLELSNFFNYITEELGVGSSRWNNIRSTISMLSKFVVKFYDEDFPDFKPAVLSVIDSAPKEQRREKTVLSDEQVENLLAHLVETDSQQACWIALAICSGARIAELLRFEVDLIDVNRHAFGDLFLETTKAIKTKGRGKAGKMLHKYILREKFLPYYETWLKDRAEILKRNKVESNSLFIKSDGSPATQITAQGWTKEFEQFLGVDVYMHSFRHYFVTLLSRKNIPYHLIQYIVGWSDMSMVQVYDDSSIAEKEFPELENLRNI